MALTKRAQLEAQGWKFTAVPCFRPEGYLGHNPETGWKSPAYHDANSVKAWIATPPEGHHAQERRFDDYSPFSAVKWAGEQAQARPLDSGLSGIAAIADLMQKARWSGVVAETADAAPVVNLPDGRLLSLCREALGADRIAESTRAERLPPRIDDMPIGKHPVHRENYRRLCAALRTKEQALPLLVDLRATTREGVVAKAKVVGTLWSGRSGKMALVQSLVEDVLAVLDDGTAPQSGSVEV